MSRELKIEEVDYVYDNVLDLHSGQEVFDVVPDVESEDISTWREVLTKSGFYIKVDIINYKCDIYYASPSYVEKNYGEYSTCGWGN